MVTSSLRRVAGKLHTACRGCLEILGEHIYLDATLDPPVQ